MVSSGYTLAQVDDVPLLRMGEIDDVPDDFAPLGVQNLDEEELNTEEMKVKLWYIPPGERMGTHGHTTQEEFYFVLEGNFRVDIGSPGDTDTHQVGPGTVFAASPEVARGYENIGDHEGRILVVSAPNVSEGGIPEREMGE